MKFRPFLVTGSKKSVPKSNHQLIFIMVLPTQISLITWPIGRPPAERRGVQGGDPPAKELKLLLKYCKKKATTAWLQQIGVSLREYSG